jgi:hypothetical protein
VFSHQKEIPMNELQTNPIDASVSENFREFPVGENGLNDKQLAGVELLAAGTGYAETARILQITPRTLYNWRQDELFQEALCERRRDLWGRANDRVRALLGPAIDVMEQQLKEKYDRTRFRAASVLLRLAGMQKTLRME